MMWTCRGETTTEGAARVQRGDKAVLRMGVFTSLLGWFVVLRLLVAVPRRRGDKKFGRGAFYFFLFSFYFSFHFLIFGESEQCLRSGGFAMIQ